MGRNQIEGTRDREWEKTLGTATGANETFDEEAEVVERE